MEERIAKTFTISPDLYDPSSDCRNSQRHGQPWDRHTSTLRQQCCESIFRCFKATPTMSRDWASRGWDTNQKGTRVENTNIRIGELGICDIRVEYLCTNVKSDTLDS